MSSRPESHPDVLIVGGGVIGLSIAYFLSKEGVSVTVLDQGQPGQEASWAGAGMLPPGNPDGSTDSSLEPAARLRALSHRLWSGFSRQLKELTGIDNGYAECGGLELAFAGETERLHQEAHALRSEGVAVESLNLAQLQQLEPAVSSDIEAAFRLRQLAQIRNPRHVKALISACLSQGVHIVAGAAVRGFDTEQSAYGGSRILAAKTIDRDFPAGKFVIAGGAWTQSILAGLGIRNVPVRPVRGQIALLAALPLPFTHVLNHGSRYLVPRSDGRILIGATEEHVGFEKGNTVSGIGGLLEFAQCVVPGLASAKLERTWSGLRPGSPSGNPFLGQLPHSENGYLAAGHFRAGLQLSPGTGQLMAQLITNQQLGTNLDAFRLPVAL
jgi:glycine oxidase